MKNTRPNERGNVMFYILIGVTLLAALIFAVSQSGRGSVQQVNVEKAKLLASEIIDYSNTVATATAQLRLRGCKLGQLSFAHNSLPAYDNADAPSDKTCDIFELAGGGVTFKNPPQDAIALGETAYQIISGEIEVNGVGTTCGMDGCVDLVMFTGKLSNAVCAQINQKLGLGSASDPIPVAEADTDSTSPFNGDGGFGHEETLGEEPTATAINGKTAGCYDNGGDGNFFYKVLQSR